MTDDEKSSLISVPSSLSSSVPEKRRGSLRRRTRQPRRAILGGRAWRRRWRRRKRRRRTGRRRRPRKGDHARGGGEGRRSGHAGRDRRRPPQGERGDAIYASGGRAGGEDEIDRWIDGYWSLAMLTSVDLSLSRTTRLLSPSLIRGHDDKLRYLYCLPLRPPAAFAAERPPLPHAHGRLCIDIESGGTRGRKGEGGSREGTNFVL